ncbi:hypothetical protein Hanom_Chr10g00890131 [Helianthus anomalus]
MRRKVRVTSTMFTMKFANSLKCVCVCFSSRVFLTLQMCISLTLTHCIGIYT